MNTDLRDKVVLITGASGGLGAAMARAFAAEGARVVLHAHRGIRRARDLAASLPPGAAWVVSGDLRREPAVRRVFAGASRHFGRLDVLVANAASWEANDVPLHRMTLRQWEDTQRSVLTSTFLCAREFLAIVARQHRGNAVLIGSTAGVFGEAGHADYAAAKAAIAFGLTRTLKNEIARLAPPTRDYVGGRINCVCPGWTVVPRTAPGLRNPDTIRRLTSTMALPKLGQPDDIAHAVVYLASDRLAGHVTGQTMVVAGGMEGRRLWAPDEVDIDLAANTAGTR